MTNMKNLLALLLFTAAISLSFTSSTFSTKVEWLTDTKHDFGVLMHKQPGVHYFSYKNISGEPLTVDNIRTTCGCTSPEWEDIVIMPDSTGIIKIEYDAQKLGYFQKFAKVFFHGQKKSEKLVIEGEVIENDE
ncbi:MAG: hypothetical protein ACI9XO_004990 [Paraglaciecola sp.]|jgi:hypothetical protein